MLGEEEDEQRHKHHHHRCDEAVVDAGVEHVEILLAEGGHVGEMIARELHLAGQRLQVGGIRLGQGAVDEGVAEAWQVGVVGQLVHVEPPRAQQWRDERRCQGTHIDEHIEDLESSVALSLCPLQALCALTGGVALKVVVHLSDDGLQVALEQTVAHRDEDEGEDGEREQGGVVLGSGEDGHRQAHITQRHDQETAHDGALVVLGAVGDDTAHEAHYIDCGEEEGGNQAAGLVGQSEFGTEEECQHGVHDVIAEALAHVAEGCKEQSFGMVFEHRLLDLVVNDRGLR